ncbi:DUF1566 domain-containing protein [Brevundimonas sp.]|jgi:hypothetical protein|uniref:Lcl C-terminal domain-containing protein n=1 Tax=Brevundimonas sp. TaxID=1871086 RepID=UPI003919ACA9
MTKGVVLTLVVGLVASAVACAMNTPPRSYPVVGTGQDRCYGADGSMITCPPEDQPFSGQDAQSPGTPASYRDNADGTVTDLVTGLQWAKAPSERMTFAELPAFARASRIGGHDDWRVPSVKELYSLIDFRGGYSGDPQTSRPYIDTEAFSFRYASGTGLGDAVHGQRPIDVQLWTATRYLGRTMGGDETVFGVNFADGRIKGYPMMDPANRMLTPNRLAVLLVRGPAYGQNSFEPTPQTVRDHATGLEWQRSDSGQALSWGDGLAYCNGLALDGHGDWRLPNAKELQTIVDYGRIPAIAAPFRLVQGDVYLWSSTTHLEGPPPPTDEDRPFSRTGELAVYFAIGPALGRMEQPPGSGLWRWMDVHGAGSQRSDPKTAVPGQFSNGFGPQGDDIRGHNHVLCVRRLAS